MKKIFQLLVIAMLFIACNKDNDTIAPIDQLPEATQTGENTFGCLLNGEAFLPSGGVNPLDCVYEYYYGSYLFALQGNRRDDLGYLKVIAVCTNSKVIKEGETYLLKENEEGNAYGLYIYYK